MDRCDAIKLILWNHAFNAVVLTTWLGYMIAANRWSIYAEGWPVALVMMAAGFIAGSTPMGGGVIAYPILVLALGNTPLEFRTFSLMMQSIGMTSASWRILRSFKDHLNALLLTTGFVLSFIGYNLGYYWVTPNLSGPMVQTVYFTKMFFLTVLMHAYIDYVNPAERSTDLSLRARQLAVFVPVVLVGGIATSMTGTGSDIWTYLYYRLFFNTEEILTTNHTVIIMSATSLFAMFNAFVIQTNDVSAKLVNHALCSVPSVLLTAPVGAFVVNRWFKYSPWWKGYIYLLESSQMVAGFALTISKSWQTIAASVGMLAVGVSSLFGRYMLVDRARKNTERKESISRDETEL